MEWIEFIHVGLAFVFCFITLFCIFADITEDTNYTVIAFVITIVLFGSLLFGQYKLNHSYWEYSSEPYRIEKIAALNDNNLMYGRFYLRSGYIDEDLYYQYIIKSGSGFNTSRVKASDATLYYDTDNYRVEWYKAEKGWLYFREVKSYAKIYVPQGSITENYAVDLE